MEIYITKKMNFGHSRLFGECPNDEWDHYVEFKEVKRRGRPKGSKNKIKNWFDYIFN